MYDRGSAVLAKLSSEYRVLVFSLWIFGHLPVSRGFVHRVALSVCNGLLIVLYAPCLVSDFIRVPSPRLSPPHVCCRSIISTNQVAAIMASRFLCMPLIAAGMLLLGVKMELIPSDKLIWFVLLMQAWVGVYLASYSYRQMGLLSIELKLSHFLKSALGRVLRL